MFDLNDFVEGFSVFLHLGGLWWKGALGGLGDHGEGRPWCDNVDCFSGSSKLVMHLST